MSTDEYITQFIKSIKKEKGISIINWAPKSNVYPAYVLLNGDKGILGYIDFCVINLSDDDLLDSIERDSVTLLNQIRIADSQLDRPIFFVYLIKAKSKEIVLFETNEQIKDRWLINGLNSSIYNPIKMCIRDRIGAEIVEYCLKEEKKVEEDILGILTEDIDMIFLCNPKDVYKRQEEGEASTSEATPDEMNESKSEVNITDMEPLSEDDFILTLVQYVGRVDPEMIMNFGEGDATKNGSAILAREYQREIFGKDMTWVANYDSKGCVEDFEVKLPDTDADKWAEAINKEVSEDEFVEGTTEWTVNNGKIVLEEKSGALTIKITAQ